MIFFKKTRETIGRFFLEKRLKQQKREVRLQAIGQIKTAAIIFDASSERSYHQTLAFSMQLKSSGTDVKTIGYIDSPKQQIPSVSDHSFMFTRLKDFSFFFLPQTSGIKKLANTPFDALFVLTGQTFFPLKTLVHLSSARFKVGFSGIWGAAMDLTIDLPGYNCEELVKQINHYLGHIKAV